MSTVTLTPESLKDLIAAAVTAAVQEARKPLPPTDKELSQIQMELDQRRDNAESLKAAEANKRAFQRVCSHEHSRREGGGTHCVYVREESPLSPGYILCQLCQGRIRPTNARKTENGEWMDRTAIHDTALFNKLFQDCNDGQMLG